MREYGAFTRNRDGFYHIDYDKALEAIDAWADLILTTQATGNYMFAKEYSANHAKVSEALSADIAHINNLGIPRDITFEFVW